MPAKTKTTQTTTIIQVDPRELRDHEAQIDIYGETDDDPQLQRLIEHIRESGHIEPLVITQDQRIISGHRRRQAAIVLGYATVPAERREYADATDELEALLVANAYREKTVEQKVREGEQWAKIEREKARRRQEAARFGSPIRLEGPNAEVAPLGEQGATRDKVAALIGIGSGRTYERAKQTVATADDMRKAGQHVEGKALLSVLNHHSVDAAHRIVKLPEDDRSAVLHKFHNGDAKTLRQALRQLHRDRWVEGHQAHRKNGEQCRLIHASLEHLTERVEAGSVDRIITCGATPNNAYPLGVVAAHALREGGSLFALVTPDTIELVQQGLRRAGLTPYWVLAWLHLNNPSKRTAKVKVNTYWQPVIWAVLGEYNGMHVSDVIRQGEVMEAGLQALLERAEVPDELVLDPLCGAECAVGVATLAAGKRFIGADGDKENIEQARKVVG